jgi:undecaprenyl diphosphate synthase
MTQRTFSQTAAGLHVAVIMDGNGRWAMRRGQPRVAGHRVGARVVRRIVEAAPDLGIGTLTLYAFSSDNWRRPTREVNGLMRLFRAYLAAETARCVQNGVRLNVIGRRDRLSRVLVEAIRAAEEKTAAGKRLLLRMAIDYSAQDAIVAAAARVGPGADRECFATALGAAIHSQPAPEVDLLIRTGGEQRLSDFLLWESAYAELYFDDCLWPDFGETRLREALRDYALRERRFGTVPQAAAG